MGWWTGGLVGWWVGIQSYALEAAQSRTTTCGAFPVPEDAHADHMPEDWKRVFQEAKVTLTHLTHLIHRIHRAVHLLVIPFALHTVTSF